MPQDGEAGQKGGAMVRRRLREGWKGCAGHSGVSLVMGEGWVSVPAQSSNCGRSPARRNDLGGGDGDDE
jgi:hypothetical protein